MPRIINHSERKDAILKAALNIFCDVGFKNTSLSLIAERCAINRPILYLYFSDKNQIFYYAIKKHTNIMYQDYIAIAGLNISSTEKLKKIFKHLLVQVEGERMLVEALANFYIELRLAGQEKLFSNQIHRRTIQFKHLLYKILKQGEECGELKKDSKLEASLLFSLCQGSLLQLALFKQQRVEPLVNIAGAVIDKLIK